MAESGEAMDRHTAAGVAPTAATTAAEASDTTKTGLDLDPSTALELEDAWLIWLRYSTTMPRGRPGTLV